MKKKLCCLFATISLFTLGFTVNAEGIPAGDIFREVERVQLKLDNEIFASIAFVSPTPDGFVLTVAESHYGSSFFLIKVSRKGEVVSKYDKRGNGPGELGYINNIAVSKDSVFIAEANRPTFHEFSHNLEFKNDYRVKKPGHVYLLGKYIGCWNLNFKKEGKKDKTYLLELYDKETFEFKKLAFEMTDIPLYVRAWGGICNIDENTFAGVYCNQYQVFLFDKEFNLKKKMFDTIPNYIKAYSPYKGNRNIVKASNADKWLHSWSKLVSVFYLDGKLIIKHLYNKKRFLDIVSLDGKKLVSNYEENKNCSISFVEGDYLWFFEWNDDKTKFSLVKVRLELR